MSKQKSLINIINENKENKIILNKIDELLKQVDVGKEFEFIMYNFNKRFFGLEKYINLIKYLTLKTTQNKLSIIKYNILDIVYSQDINTNYRISIEEDYINSEIEQLHKYKNHVIFSTLVVKIIEGNTNISIMKKKRETENYIDLEDYNIRVRLSDETILTKNELEELSKLTYVNGSKIVFRKKDRISFYILGNKDSDEYIKIDITTTKMSKRIDKINDMIPNYELEIEYGINKKINKKNNNILDIMFNEAEKLLKIIQVSNYIISNSLEKQIIKEYAEINKLDYEKILYLDARQPLSLEIQHVTEILPNKYAVTDKADGDRCFLFISNNHIYFISTNLNVRDSGIELPKKLSKYNNSILDGEFIFLSSKNRYLYMVFDCLFNGNLDVRKIDNFIERLAHADDIINNCFIFGTQKGYILKDYSSTTTEYNLNNIIKFHDEQLRKYMVNLNNDIEIEKKYPLIRRKYFLPVSGAKPWEIFKFSTFLWDKYNNDSTINYPYLLDGLIYHPLNQAYITNSKETKLFEYKWKPPEKNSIDFYILFQRDKDTGNILTVYDNSIDDHVKNKPYKICNLYVGKKDKYKEQPTLFREEQGGYIANLFLKDGEPVDIEGNLINDNTVVEFYYKNDNELNESFQWIPIRTRYDKTESVLKHGKKYGNYIDVANKIWRSIVNPILISDFEDLAKGNDEKGNYYYDKKINNLRNKIGHDLIVSTTKENIYFQIKTNIANTMRQFHNWVKSIIIYTYCNPMYQQNKSLSVLDIACGKGQDIMKFYYSKVSFLVGVDIDMEALTSAIDGAISRYKKFQRSKPGFPKMDFIHADLGTLLNYDDQFRALKGMSNENRILFNKYFNNKVQFDRINCQFALHYFLKNKDIWNNFKQNLKNYLKPSGYFLASTFDAHVINKLLSNTDKYTVYYTDDNGNKKILFELVKKFPNYNEKDIISEGNGLDVYLSWFMQEGNYTTEYLVDKNFIEKELLETCELELVDTGMFDELFNIHREYFMKYAQYEDNIETRKFLLNVKNYYDNNDDLTKNCYYNTKLIRYYIFRRKDVNIENSNTKKSQKGGILDLDNKELFEIPFISSNKKSCCNSICDILKTNKIIPNTISSKSFFKDYNLKYISDDELNENYFNKLINNINIEHNIENKKRKTILNGLNIIIVEKNCNNELDIDFYMKDKNSRYDKVVLLYKNDNEYRPIYRKENNKLNGIFLYKDPMIQKLIEN